MLADKDVPKIDLSSYNHTRRTIKIQQIISKSMHKGFLTFVVFTIQQSTLTKTALIDSLDSSIGDTN